MYHAMLGAEVEIIPSAFQKKKTTSHTLEIRNGPKNVSLCHYLLQKLTQICFVGSFMCPNVREHQSLFLLAGLPVTLAHSGIYPFLISFIGGFLFQVSTSTSCVVILSGAFCRMLMQQPMRTRALSKTYAQFHSMHLVSEQNSYLRMPCARKCVLFCGRRSGQPG